MQTARLGEGLVVHGGETHAEGDREGRLLGAEGHLVQDHGAEVALILSRAAEVEELALRTPSTRGNGRTQCAARRVGRVGLVKGGDKGPCRARDPKASLLLLLLRPTAA